MDSAALELIERQSREMPTDMLVNQMNHLHKRKMRFNRADKLTNPVRFDVELWYDIVRKELERRICSVDYPVYSFLISTCQQATIIN